MITLKNIKIKMARLEKNMTQQELADKIGITRQTIGLIETGNYNPTIKLCLKICYALNKSLDELFWEDKNNEE
ncbi:helix-turn-helix transcriptional regulator [Facklamia sp. 7083-14-GEN3]|nr:helix-turn-helix transcriptional regulator [Facklamia sp. 7083-14-GEN3]